MLLSPRRDAGQAFSDNTAGVLLAMLGVALFTPIFAAGKLSGGVAPALLIMAMRYLGGAITVSVAIAATQTPLSALRSDRIWFHVLRAFCGIGGGAFTIHAATTLPVADAASIGLTKGLLIVLFAAVILGESLTLRHLLAGLLCASGAAVVVWATVGAPGADGGGKNLEGAVSAFAGAVLIAFEALLIKVLSRREHALGVLIHANGIAATLFFFPALWLACDAELGAVDVAPFLLLGPLAIAGQYCNVLAYRRADAVILGPVGYSWILFSAILGYLWFEEVPGPESAVGAALIIAGGIGLARIRT